MTTDSAAIADVLAYHERSKHHLHRYARSLGYLDWDTQPEPFRTFAGTARTPLPLAAGARRVPASVLWRAGGVPAEPITLETLGVFLELALGLSAWKELGDARWALRNTPSSGNLHPTEAYVVTAGFPGIAPGVHHYVSRDHELEARGVPTAAGVDALRDAPGGDTFLLGMSSVTWREAWKYGERAWRYAQHDAGHAVGAARFAAAVLGWSADVLADVPDALLARLLGLNAGVDRLAERAPDPETPAVLLRISRGPGSAGTGAEGAAGPDLTALAGELEFTGRAEPPSTAGVEWEILDVVDAAAALPAGVGEATMSARDPSARRADPVAGDADAGARPAVSADEPPAVTLIRSRRSAVSFDGVTALERAAFETLLARLVPVPGAAPFDALPWAPLVHPLLFVHRVRGLDPGLYLLERARDAVVTHREAFDPAFEWRSTTLLPAGARLWCLRPGDFRDAARTISCHQEIAADGAFSLGMLAQFGDTIRDRGAWWYRRLFLEAGLLGQALYLAAGAAGISGTGIGCYFDDAMHELLGLKEDRFQSLYHFTVGAAVHDPRLVSFPPYAARDARRG